jgi:diadenylate cyclase
MDFIRSLFVDLTFYDLLRALVDIGLVAFILYRMFLLIKGTRAVPIITGIVIIFLLKLVTQWLSLYTMNWLLSQFFVLGAVAIPVVFQPELRRALEQLGRGRLLPAPRSSEQSPEDNVAMVDQVVRAVEVLSRTKTGALLVIERETGLGDVAESGIPLDGKVTWELLVNTFVPNTPLHDGAVIIRGNRVVAAACWLPLAEASELSKELGSRHRSAIGITEHADCISVVVSEETGTISIAEGGKIVRHLNEQTLRERLTAAFSGRTGPVRGLFNWGAN